MPPISTQNAGPQTCGPHGVAAGPPPLPATTTLFSLAVFLATPCGRLLAAALLACALALPARAGAPEGPESLPVAHLDGSVMLGRHLQLLEDPGGQMGLAAVQKAVGWQRQRADVLSLGFSRSAWWARVVLLNESGMTVARLLEVGTPLQDEVDFYIVRAGPGGSTDVTHVATGDRRPFANRTIQSPVPTEAVRLAPGESVTVYLRLGTYDGLHEAVAPRLWKAEAYMGHQQQVSLVVGSYYGALATLLLYNLFLFFSTRQRNFGLYALYVGAFLVWSFAFRGLAYQYLWPGSPAFANQMLPVSVAACFAGFGAFLVSYLDTRRHLPRGLHRALVVATVANGLSALPALFGVYAIAFALSMVACLGLMGLSLVAMVKMILAGSRPARYLMLAFTVLALAVAFYYLTLTGVLPSVGRVDELPLIGSMLEVLLLALGLADQMNTLKAGKLHAERQALIAQTALNSDLERQVRQRTAALAAANQRLADMAITDDLTGAYNRRHFNAVLEATMARHARSRTPVAFCMLDVDHFKQYNDRYGHPAGDAVLQAVSRAVRARLSRAGDHFFRIGGEEFGILLECMETLDATLPFVEQVRQAIEALALPHAGSSHGVVTASFGLVLLSRGGPPIRGEELVARADQLLYEAKHAGRNRVVAEAR